uniref:RxLR effector protein n=1 Tax=Phytophthora ramorum TaxID=164328 RepID=H3GMM8_PHYRM
MAACFAERKKNDNNSSLTSQFAPQSKEPKYQECSRTIINWQCVSPTSPDRLMGDAVLEQTKTTKEALSPGATQWERSLTTEETAAPVKPSLRGAKMADGDEERGITVPAAAKTFGAKLKRLALYNKWIFGNVKPEDVVASKYYAGYLKFYENRMVPGGKYA